MNREIFNSEFGIRNFRFLLAAPATVGDDATMSSLLPPGKVPWDVIADLLSGSLPPEVLLGPAIGEDAALVEIGGELWAVASDPITFTAAEAGRLAVIVNANDVAVRGARPMFFVAVGLIAPAEASEDRVRELLAQIQDDLPGSRGRLDRRPHRGHFRGAPQHGHWDHAR